MRMRNLFVLLLLSIPALGQSAFEPKLPSADAVRIKEFYHLAAQIQDKIWPGWSAVPSPLLLVTPDAEFLTHHPAIPTEFKKVGDDLYARPRKFPTSFQATFPAFGPPSVIVIGEPESTASKSSTPWLFTVMHEHFHQLQNAQPGYNDGVNALGLSRGDTTGMWMLNFPFPYDKPEVGKGFNELRDLLLQALNETDEAKLRKSADAYVARRKQFFALLSADEHKYFAFQLWQEGIARYTEVKSAEAAGQYQPSMQFAALPDFQPFAVRASQARAETLSELKQTDLATWKRTVVYSFGAAEGFLLDRIHPSWKSQYFQHMFSTDSYFEAPK